MIPAPPPDPQVLKDELNIGDVCLHYGIELQQSGDRLVGLCPFHDDKAPSFSVLPSGTHVGCMACGFGPEDLFGFLQRWHQCDFKEAMRIARELLAEGMESSVEVRRRVFASKPVEQILAEAADNDGIIQSLLAERGIKVPIGWLKDEFNVKGDGDSVLIPHGTAGLKRRSTEDGWQTRASIGSALNDLYGSWRDKGKTPVVLCEGESDTWSVAYWFRDRDYVVLGLPSGVSARPKPDWLEQLAGRTVYLLFDADRAGREGVQTWAGLLSDVKVCVLPEGSDATAAGEETVLAAVAAAVSLSMVELRLSVEDDRYVRKTDNGSIPVSNFVLTALRSIKLEDSFAIEVRLNDGTEHTITSAEFTSSARMRTWANRKMYSWTGNDRDAQDLLELMMFQCLFVPRVEGVSVAGWHKGAFVLPDETLGSSAYVYIPPPADVHLSHHLSLEEGDWSLRVPRLLSELHSADVITPILGWIAAAPVRALVKNFPILAVVGGAGWGKTTLLSQTLGAFGFWTRPAMTLAATTPHAVNSACEATNGLPMWFDEYREGVRLDARQALDQVLRNAWDSAASQKGGQGENKLAIQSSYARAPIVVTGEDAFQETSHLERMVLVQMPKSGRQPDVLRDLQLCRTVGFGRAYIEWLIEFNRQGLMHRPPNELDRPRQARAVAAWGYDLLRQFCRDNMGYDLKPIDLSRVLSAHEKQEDPVVESLREFIGLSAGRDGYGLVWIDGDDVCVRLTPWVKEVKDVGTKLFGNTRAIRNYLNERWSVVDVAGPLYRYQRVIGAANEVVCDCPNTQ